MMFHQALAVPAAKTQAKADKTTKHSKKKAKYSK
jgi:hypothetical protein